MRKISCAAVFLLVCSLPLFAQPVTDLGARDDVKVLPSNVRSTIIAVSAASSQPVAISVDPQSGAIRNLKGSVRVQAPSNQPAAIARAFLQRHGKAFGIASLANLQFSAPETSGDIRRIRVQQTVGALPVFGPELVIDTTRDGTVVGTCGSAVPIAYDPHPAHITAANAAARLRTALGLAAGTPVHPRLGVLADPSISGKPQLVYALTNKTAEGSSSVYLSADTGRIVGSKIVPSTISTSTTPCNGALTPQFHLNAATHVPDFITFGQPGLWLAESATGTPSEVALAFFRQYPLVFGTGDVPHQLQVTRVQQDRTTPFMTHVVLQQLFAAIPCSAPSCVST